jgi:DNA-binding transcriptional regulator GbsR (MarR family)
MQDINDKIYSTFSAVATSLGYSEVHGRIISCLLVEDKTLSLEELSTLTGYSPGSISLSLDLLELVGMVKKIKNKGDRRLFVRLDGDLLEGLRNALLFKLKKEITRTLDELGVIQTNKKSKKTITSIEQELRRLDEYVKRLSEVPLPKKN